jgi:hypothetical protein
VSWSDNEKKLTGPSPEVPLGNLNVGLIARTFSYV